MARDTTGPAQATILVREAGHYTVAVWGDVGIVHWLAQANGAAMQRVRKSWEPMVEAHPGGVSFIHLIEGGAGLPDLDARRVLTEMMRSFKGSTICVAAVLMGAGFWASALQSLLTGMRLVAPPSPWLMRFASRPSDLRKWFPYVHAQRGGRYIDPDQLAPTLERVLAIGQPAQAMSVAD